jgi:unspecific monooxygenase
MTSSVRPDPAAPYAPPAGAAAATTFDPATFDPHAPAYLADPYATYAAFRQLAPVHYMPQYHRWWVFRHADVAAALRDTATFVKTPPGGWTPAPGIFGATDALPRGLLSSDPPRHDLLRGSIEPLFRAALAGAPAVAAGLADRSLAAMRAGAGTRTELMARYALEVPSGTLFSLLGLPEADWPQLRQLITAIVAAHDVTQSMGVMQAGGVAAMALTAYWQGRVREAAAKPDDTLVGRMVTAALAAGYAPEDVQMVCFDFVVAGYLTTTFVIGTGTLNLLNHPDQLALLQADPTRIGAAVDEMLRIDAPAQMVDRIVAADGVTIAGVAIPRGDGVTFVLGSANRDETVFAEPDRFDMARADARQAIPFGAGIHHCIGAPLVMITAPTAIARLVAALPGLRVDGTVQWLTDPYLRSPASLPLAFG